MRGTVTERTRCERRGLAFCLVCVALVLHPASVVAQPGARPPADVVAPAVDVAHAFDFVVGLWKVEERRSMRPLMTGLTSPNEESLEITQGISAWRPIAGGVGLIEEAEIEHAGAASSSGATVLSYTAAARRWSLTDFNGLVGVTSLTGRMPCRGSPGRCAGEFVGSDTIDGRVVLARDQIRVWGLNVWEWDRQVSPDGGLHWETVRHRHYSRTGADSAASLPAVAAVPRGARTAYCCSQMELRRYSASADGLRVLEDLFREENRVGRSVGIQELLRSGLTPDSSAAEVYWMQNLALLRDIDHPGSYVWLRGITVNISTDPSPFYLAAPWSLHQEAVQRAGIRSTDAHLLMTWATPPGFVIGAATPDGPAPRGLLVANIYILPESKLRDIEGYFEYSVAPLLHATGGRPVASFISVTGWQWRPHIAQAFGPTSPLDTGVFVWFARFANAESYRRHVEALQRDTTWQRTVQPHLQELSPAPPQVWRLEPLPGSRVIY